jgi:hypothetical protein
VLQIVRHLKAATQWRPPCDTNKYRTASNNAARSLEYVYRKVAATVRLWIRSTFSKAIAVEVNPLKTAPTMDGF